MSNTLLTLRKRVRSAVSDGFREAVTTSLTTDKLIVSTNLNKWDGGNDDYFNDWFAYVEDFTNAGDNRVISDYATSGGSCTVRGANFTSDTADLATVMFTRMNPDTYLEAIQTAVRSLDDKLFRHLDDLTLLTSNLLPNSHFEDQTTSGTPDLYTLSSVTGTKTTTAGLYRGPRGRVSIKLTDSGSGGGYMSINSKTWPALLRLQGHTVSFYTDAYPATADDAEIEIYTVSNDGSTTQTLTSDTSNAATQWTKLKLEDQNINDDLTYIEFRWKVTTASDAIYFDNAYLTTGLSVYEHLLPKDFRDGELTDVYVVLADPDKDPFQDKFSENQRRLIKGSEWNLYNDGTYEYIRTPAFGSRYYLRLIGYKPLETLSSDSDTISVNDPQLDLIIAQSALELYKIEQGTVGVSDSTRYNRAIGKWEFEVFKLSRLHQMTKPSMFFGVR